MSLVGTRPPTVDEWDKYELQRAVTHMWSEVFPAGSTV